MITLIAEFLSSYLRFNLHGLLNLMAALFGIAVGTIVLLQNSRSSVNRSFFFLTATTCVWLIGFGMQSLVRHDESSWLWISIDYFFGVPFIPVFFYFLSSNLLKEQSKHERGIRIAMLIWAIAAAIPMVFFTKRIVDILQLPWGRYLLYRSEPFGIAYVTFLLIPFFVILSMAFAQFWKGWKTAVSPVERRQRRNILMAVLLGYTGATDYLTGFGLPIYPFGYISLSLFIGIVAYTIIRHQFFNINVLLQKFAIVGLIYSFLFAVSIPLVSFLINRYFPEIQPSQLVFLLFLSVLLSLILAAGPMTYAFIQNRAFWLKAHSSTGLAHELKSPLAAIQGAVQMLLYKESRPQMSQQQTFDYLHMIERSTERLDVFVQDLLKIAQIQSDDVILNRSMLDLRSITSEVVDTYRVLAATRNVSFQLQFADASAVEGDIEKLRQTVSNLISNALKFTANGTITLSIQQELNHVKFSVRDTGTGIQKADLPKVFQRFYHGAHSNKGSGLGLTIAKAWVEAHGGKIWAESEGEGKGATVTFTLPVV